MGVLGIFISFSIDVSVATPGGGRVNNIGLISERQNILLLSVGLLIIGSITHIKNLKLNADDYEGIDENDQYRLCPFCAEKIKRQASICKHCKSAVTPEDPNDESSQLKRNQKSNKSSSNPDLATGIIEKINGFIENYSVWREKNRIKISYTLISIAIFSILYKIIKIVFFTEYSINNYFGFSFEKIKDFIPVIILAIYARFWRIAKQNNYKNTSLEDAHKKINFRGFEIDPNSSGTWLCLSLLWFLISGYLTSMDLSVIIVLSIALTFLGILTTIFSNKIQGCFYLAIGGIATFKSWSLSNDFLYQHENFIERLSSPTIFPTLNKYVFGEYIFLTITILLPALQLIKIFQIRIGQFKGDTILNVLGIRIPMYFGSSTFLFSLAYSIKVIFEEVVLQIF